MSSIAGVTVAVFQNEKKVPVANDGYLGKLSTKPLVLQVTIAPERHDVHGFTVDGTKNVVPKKDVADDPTAGKIYQLKIPVQAIGTSGAYTTYPTNNLRLVEGAEVGTANIWELAVVSQNNDFFLTQQLTYQADCYVQKGQATYPRFENWPQLNEFLVPLLSPNLVLEPIEAYQADEMLPTSGLGNFDGIVQWFNDAQGLGALVTKNGVARIHWSQLPKRPRRAYVRGGEKVRFQQLRLPKQTKERPTGFKKEAVGVTLL